LQSFKKFSWRHFSTLFLPPKNHRYSQSLQMILMRSLRRKIAIALRACASSIGLIWELRSSKGRLGRRAPPGTITAGHQKQAAPDLHECWPKWSDALRADRGHRETVSRVECVKAGIMTWHIIV
jgi:hypothetical protein